MKPKALIIIIVTLIIVFVLGMLTSAQIRNHRLKPVKIYFSEQRFREGFYKIIMPDEDQKAKIDLVLSKYGKVNSEIQNDFRKKIDSMMKDFWAEMGPLLTKEQLGRLKEMDERRKEMIKQSRRSWSDSSARRGDRPPFPGEHRRPFISRDSTVLPDTK
jgi:hypothetical protein